jgi:uncharacterized membrane protein
MRLRCSSAVGIGYALGLAIGGCGNGDQSAACGADLTYETFGEPFMTDWCTGCHSDLLPPGMRQNAPTDINFDTLDEIRAQSQMISLTVQQATMPPEGGPSDAEREMLVQWLGCGAP